MVVLWNKTAMELGPFIKSVPKRQPFSDDGWKSKNKILSNKELNWLDTLFKKNSVDFIISKPIYPSKTKNVNFVDKIIKELFHQASYILKKKGLMLLITPKTELLEKYAKEYKFKIKEELNVLVGDINYKILSFKKVI